MTDQRAGETEGESQDLDWRELYRLARVDAERERKRKADEAVRRRETRHRLPRRPEIDPAGSMPQPGSGGAGWGVPGRNPMMAGGDYDRMPHLPIGPVRLWLCSAQSVWGSFNSNHLTRLRAHDCDRAAG